MRQQWLYGYDSAGQLSSVQDPLSGDAATVSTNAQGLITSIQASNGAQAQFTWSTLGTLESASLPGYSVQFRYDARRWLSGMDFGAGQTITIGYDANGDIASVQDRTSAAAPDTQRRQAGVMAQQRSAMATAMFMPIPPGLAAGLEAAGATGAAAAQRASQCEQCNPYRGPPMLSQQARLPLQLQASILLSATLGEAAQNLLNAVLTYSASRELAKNLQCKTDAYYQAKPEDGCYEAHHIVPYADGRFPSAIQARAILAQVGIDINSAANGVWVECKRHRRMHNWEYYEALKIVLEKATPRNREEVTKALNVVRMGILSKTFPGTAF